MLTARDNQNPSLRPIPIENPTIAGINQNAMIIPLMNSPGHERERGFKTLSFFN